jgi:hypothetical protein
MTAFRRLLSYVPGLYQPYSHLLLENESAHSHVHLHNFLSVIWPEGCPAARFLLKIKNSDGAELARKVVHLEPLGVLSAPVHSVFPALVDFPTMGTLSVRLKSDRKIRKYARSRHKGLVRFPSPFWMQYSSSNGSDAYVHSVGTDHSDVRLIDLVLNMISRTTHRGGCWESSRTYEMQTNESIDIFLLNQNRSSIRQNIKLVRNDKTVVFSKSVDVGSGGVTCVSFKSERPESVFLKIDKLSTSNSKPYVLVRSANEMFSLTHG